MAENEKSIIGTAQVQKTTLGAGAGIDKSAVHQTNSRFWDTTGADALGETALPLYGAFVSEENNRLFGDVTGKTVLEVGCGSGHSLQYLAQRGAAELWGVDLSENQIERAGQTLAAHGHTARLVCAPMEAECGIPEGHFDCVYSIYAIGWTTDLEGTFRRIAGYLKPGGAFIFSWSHPIHKCVAAENGAYLFSKCYFDERWYSVPLGGGMLSLSDRMLSTYVNALANAGFAIERLIERPDDALLQKQGEGGDFAKKAAMLPLTFVLKARKL